MTDISAIHAFDKWWNTRPEQHIPAPRQCHVGMQQERMMAIWMAAFEAGRQQGMRQERAMWELSAMTQEFESFDRTASHMAGEYVSHYEPTAWINHIKQTGGDFYDLNVSGRGIPLYRHPQQTKPLSNEEIDEIESMCSVNEQGQINGREFAKLILKKASEL